MFKKLIFLHVVVLWFLLGRGLQADELDVLYNSIARKLSNSLLLTDFNLHSTGEIDRLVINIPSFELYACKGREIVKIYKISLGRKGLPTPEGKFILDGKVKDPIYIPLEGSPNKKIADYFPPGDNNPMGTRKMHFYGPIYIHGIPQNKRHLVGRTKNGSCIALLKENIEELYDRVLISHKVEIYYKVNRVTFNGKTAKIESFSDLYRGFRRKVTDMKVFPPETKYYPVRYLKTKDFSAIPIECWQLEQHVEDDILLILK